MKISKKTQRRFFSKTKLSRETGCLEWLAGKNSCARGVFWWLGKQRAAHRFAYEIVSGKVPKGLEILHKCDNVGCVRFKHLYAGTQAQNMLDKKNRGRAKGIHLGEKNPQAKFTSVRVKNLRKDFVRLFRKYRKMACCRLLAKKYKHSVTGIQNILNNHIWKHI